MTDSKCVRCGHVPADSDNSKRPDYPLCILCEGALAFDSICSECQRSVLSCDCELIEEDPCF